jgi:hypothetical protein
MRSESGNSNLRVVDDLITIGVSDKGRSELEGERAFPAVVILVVIVLVLVPLVSSVRVLVLVPPFGTFGLLDVLVVLRGRSGHGEGWEDSE